MRHVGAVVTEFALVEASNISILASLTCMALRAISITVLTCRAKQAFALLTAAAEGVVRAWAAAVFIAIEALRRAAAVLVHTRRARSAQ